MTIIYAAVNKQFKINLKYLLILLSTYIPIVFFCIYIKHYFSGNFDAVVYDNSFILLLLQNYFSPILAGIQNNILNFQNVWLKGMFSLKFWIFVLFPVLLMIIFIFKCLKNFKISLYLFSVSIIYIIFHTLASDFTQYNGLVRYTLMVLPILLLLAATGFCTIKQTKLKNSLLTIYTIISILGIFTLNGAINIKRPDGYRQLAQALIDYKINPKADFIFPIRSELLEKYYEIEGRKLSLYTLNSETAQKTYLNNNEIEGIKSDRENIYAYYKRYLSTNSINTNFENYMLKEFLSKKTIVILVDKTITMFTNEQLKALANTPNYEQYPIQFLRLSKLNNDLLKTAYKHFSLKQHIIVNNWEIFVFGI